MTATLTLRRRFAVAPARVFTAWTDPAQFAQWIGPVGIPCTLLGMDPREGGGFSLDMHTPDRTIHVAGTFTRLDPPHRIELTWGAADGSILTEVSIRFRPIDQGTEMEFHHHLPARDMLPSHEAGWSSAFDKLKSFLEP